MIIKFSNHLGHEFGLNHLAVHIGVIGVPFMQSKYHLSRMCMLFLAASPGLISIKIPRNQEYTFKYIPNLGISQNNYDTILGE